MRSGRSVIWFIGPLAFLTWSGACKPKTTAQKVEDKIEDVGHEMDQGMERAGEHMEKATK